MKQLLVGLLALIVLVGCGGGGGGGDGGGSGGGGGGGGGNTAPVANAGPDQIVTIDNRVELDGSGSSDPDGNALTYNWVFTEYPSADPPALDGSTSATPSFLVTQDGEYFIALTVNDGTEASLPSEVKIVAFLQRPDDFERPVGLLSADYSWGDMDDFYPSFKIDSHADNKVAIPTNNLIHVNFWNQEFDKNQWVSFTIAKKPDISNKSSVGALLRGDIEEQEAYLVTFVPQDGDDTIRVWKVTDEFDTGTGSSAIMIEERLFEYFVDDKVTIFVFEENDGHFIEVKIDRVGGDGLYWRLEISAADIIDRGGYIGIYAVTNEGNDEFENVGAIDNFDGGNISELR